jgi:hypothetical protein
VLELTVPGVEFYDEGTNIVTIVKPTTIQMEHSLYSLAKWESKWKKSYLSAETHSAEEYADYFRCMTITKNVDPAVYNAILHNPGLVKTVMDYINDPATAARFSNYRGNQQGARREFITAESYYWQMVDLGIPFEPCEKWHLGRLAALIRFIHIKDGGSGKMNKKELAAFNTALNSSRHK